MSQRHSLEQRFAWLDEAEDTLAGPATLRERRLALIITRLVGALSDMEIEHDAQTLEEGA